ncbi:MAG TPA: dockerin type I repeat-containing protein, partial [Terriglobales bacterium]|nr:dockerin type I repeat-containing protein [Terriglobales bacterium]
FGKATKTTKPVQKQQTEQNVEPQFPKVVQGEKLQEVIMKGAPAEFQKGVQSKKGKTPAEIQQKEEQPVHVPDVNMTEEAMPVYCIVGNQTAACCYYQPAGNDYLIGWGRIRFCTYLDIENNNPVTPACAFPYYPFDVDTITTQIYAGDVCSLYVLAVTYSSRDLGGGCMFLNAVVSRSDSFWVQHPGGFLTIKVPMATANACVYGPFFGLFGIKNTDDFYTGGPFDGIPLSWIYDISGRECISYWNSNLIGTGGSFYDVVPNGIVSGAIRVRAIGHTAADNACLPPANEWYYKPATTAAPSGLPDYDQGQFPPAFCGPTAGADVLFWQLSNNSGLAIPGDVPTLVNEIAVASGTVPAVGTVCDNLETGLLNVAKAHGGWWFAETTVYAPDFVYVQKWTRQCHTFTLLLGFWQTPDGGTTWYRFGGHFVAVSGVDIFGPTYQFAISDPAIDNAEAGGPGVVTDPAGTFPHVGNFIYHNDPFNTSKDWYPVAWPSASPGGYLYLPTYVVNWPDFQGQNAGPLPNTGTFNPAFPVQVEVEQAIDLYQGEKRLSGTVNGSNVDEVNNNMGGITPFDVLFGAVVVSPLYYGSLFSGTSQADLRGDYGDYYPVQDFTPLGPPVVDNFSVAGKAGNYDIQMVTVNFGHADLADLDYQQHAFGVTVPAGGGEDAKYMIEDVYIIENEGTSPVLGLGKALFFDYDVGGNAAIVDVDQQHASLWMYDAVAPDTVFGLTEVPAVKGVAPITGWGISNTLRIYDKQYVDSMWLYMQHDPATGITGWGTEGNPAGEDMSLLMADAPFDLAPEVPHINKYIKWGYIGPIATGGDAAYRHFLYNILQTLGYYRGDVNKDGKFDVADIIYTVNYCFKGGPKPVEFVDQGDVNNDGNTNVTDIIYMVNNRFKGGPFPIDKERFYEAAPIPANQKGLTVRESLFNDVAWKTLGQ